MDCSKCKWSNPDICRNCRAEQLERKIASQVMLKYYEEDPETGKLIPLQEDTIPDEVLVAVDQAFEKYQWEHGEQTSGVVVKDPLRKSVNIIAGR